MFAGGNCCLESFFSFWFSRGLYSAHLCLVFCHPVSVWSLSDKDTADLGRNWIACKKSYLFFYRQHATWSYAGFQYVLYFDKCNYYMHHALLQYPLTEISAHLVSEQLCGQCTDYRCREAGSCICRGL